MFEESSISFKVVMIEDEQNIEIRRFEVDQGAVTNFEYIRDRLQLMFPKLRGNIFKVTWKDSEGDEVTISSDEELMIALSEMKNDIFKIQVHVISDEYDVTCMPTSSDCPVLNQQEENIPKCCHCNQTLSDNRYKCLECTNYEQCADCELQGIHSDHLMIRLKNSCPTSTNLILKFLNLIKQHFAKDFKYSVFTPLFQENIFCSGDNKEKFKGHKRRHRRFSKPSNEAQNSSGCPYSRQLLGNIDGFIPILLSMMKNCTEKQNQEEVSSPNKNSTVETQHNEKETEKSAEQAINKPEVLITSGPSTSENRNEPPVTDTPENTALQFLTEMGFNNDGKWLSHLLQRFHGDISKTLDHIMSQK